MNRPALLGYSEERIGVAIRRAETQRVVDMFRSTGASVLEWDPLREEFALALLRQLRAERGRQ